jgi:RNase P/RNase MRP subunit POP5
MKLLKPSHRENKRYILIEGKDSTTENIEKAILDFIGILGFAKACPIFVKNPEKLKILAVNRECLDEIRASFELSGLDITIKRVSGMINRLK